MREEDKAGLERALALAAGGQFDAAFDAIRNHYRERLSRGREADKEYKLLHLLILAEEAGNDIDRRAGAGETSDIGHEKHSSRP